MLPVCDDGGRNMNDLKLKVKKTYLVVGIIMTAVAVLLEIAFFSWSRTEEDGIFLLIGATVIMVLPVAVFGLLALSSYNDNKALMGRALELYGEELIVSHVRQNTLKTYKEGKNTIYFTNKLAVDPKQAVLEYNAMAWVYVTEVSTKYGTQPMLTVQMLNGKSTALCNGIKKEEALELIALFVACNPGLLVGYNKKNEEVCKQLQEKFKKGEITLRTLDLTEPLSKGGNNEF